MAFAASYVGVVPRTINADSVALVRGVRVTRGSNGLFTVQDASARGDMVTINPIEASSPGEAVTMSGGGKVPALSTEAANVGDLAYTAAGGLFCKTASAAVLVGRWTSAPSGATTLGEVELFSVA